MGARLCCDTRSVDTRIRCKRLPLQCLKCGTGVALCIWKPDLLHVYELTPGNPEDKQIPRFWRST